VGGSGVLLNLGLMYLLTDIAGLIYFASCVVAFIVVVSSNYTWNTLWTFKKQFQFKDWTKYIGTSLLALGINELALFIGTYCLHVWYMYSMAVGILVSFVINYTLSRSWVWK